MGKRKKSRFNSNKVIRNPYQLKNEPQTNKKNNNKFTDEIPYKTMLKKQNKPIFFLQELKLCLDRIEKLLYSSYKGKYRQGEIDELKSVLYSAKGYIAKVNEFIIGEDKE